MHYASLPTSLHRWRRLFFWALFTLGVLLQLFAPRLRIEHDQFVLSSPPANTAVAPAEIVMKERRVQLLSGILTVGGAVGLAFCYGRDLVKKG